MAAIKCAHPRCTRLAKWILVLDTNESPQVVACGYHLMGALIEFADDRPGRGYGSKTVLVRTHSGYEDVEGLKYEK